MSSESVANAGCMSFEDGHGRSGAYIGRGKAGSQRYVAVVGSTQIGKDSSVSLENDRRVSPSLS
jgi:hypothetical protein